MPRRKSQKGERCRKKTVSDARSERESDADFDPTRGTGHGTSNEETIHGRTPESGYDVISEADSEGLSEDDFGFYIASDIENVSERTYPGNNDVEYQNGDDTLSDRSCHHSVSVEAFNPSCPTPTPSNSFAALEKDRPSLVRANAPTLLANIPTGLRSIGDVVNSATIQTTEDQGGQDMEQESALVCGAHVGPTTATQEANHSPNPASSEMGGDRQTDAVGQSLLTTITTTKEYLEYCESLNRERIKIDEQKDPILSRLNGIEEQLERRFRTITERKRSRNCRPFFITTEKSEIKLALDKHCLDENALDFIEAKRARLDAEIKTLVAEGPKWVPSCAR